ncbi:MAG: 4Fe-4S dicluster domain-containing protein [Rhodospirillales bacterium]
MAALERGLDRPLDRPLDRRDILGGNWRGARPVRPPGALSRRRFEELCDGCGDCAAACPANAIRMTGPATAASDRSPEIVAIESPCIMCDGLACSTVCAAGALAPEVPGAMRIARVAFHASYCWTALGIDPGCDYCFDRCPLKGTAITYRRGRGPTIEAGACTGCGSCVFTCPAAPKALTLTAA